MIDNQVRNSVLWIGHDVVCLSGWAVNNEVTGQDMIVH